MSDSAYVVDMPDELGAFDTLMHRGEANPRTRSGIMGVQILDRTPDWDSFRSRFECASRRVLRMRQKVVMPTLPTAAPRWVVDPDFNLDFHVRRVRVPEPGSLRELLDLAELTIQSPLDIGRPLWSVTLVEGLADEQAAVLFHMSHAVTDGMGGAELFSHVYDFERDQAPRAIPPLPIPQDMSPNDLMRQGIAHLPGSIVGGIRGAVRIKSVREQMTQRRDDSAIDVLGAIAPVLSILPPQLLESMAGSFTPADVQASNVPLFPGEILIEGAKVLRQYGLGPLPGIAMMVVLVSLAGTCTVTVRYDRSSVTDDTLFARCLQEGFDEVLALAGDPAPHAIPASFGIG